jgi:hypothetical protein
MDTTTPSMPSIEAIVPRLDEVGNRLLDAALKIEAKKRTVELARSEVKRLELEVEDDRALLYVQVQRHYSGSEILDAVDRCLKK